MTKPFLVQTKPIDPLPEPPTDYACVTCGARKNFRLLSNGDCVCSVCGEISETARCHAAEKPFGDSA